MTLRLIQVGLGGWGRDWQRVLREERNVELVACVDPNPDALALAQSKIENQPVQFFFDLDTAFDAVPADAVLITAALPAHVPVALAAINAGKHVLLEKPFAPSLEMAHEVVEAARVRQRVLMISQNYRFYPAVRAAAQLVREQTFGPVGAVSVEFRRNVNTLWPKEHRYYHSTQPLLTDMAIHHFDLMRLVLNQEPQQVFCRAFNPPWSNFDDPPSADAIISFDGGTVVSYRGSWISTGPQTAWAGVWRMECEDGEIVWTSRANVGLSAERVTARRRGQRARRLDLPAMPQFDRAGSLAAFVHAIETGTEPESSGRDNLGSLALMSALVESARSELPLPVPHLRSAKTTASGIAAT